MLGCNDELKSFMAKYILTALSLILCLSCGYDKLAVSGEVTPPYAEWEPNGLATDNTGNLYAADIGNGTSLVEILNPDGTGVGSLGEKARETVLPLDAAIGENGAVWISIAQPPKIIRLNDNGKIDKQILDERIIFPESLDVDVQGRLWIADSESNELLVADNDGNIVMALGKDLGLNCPTDVAAAGSRMFVADFGNNRIVAVDLAGNPVTQWQVEGASPLRVGAQGELLVVGAVNEDNCKKYQMLRYSTSGKLIDSYPLELDSIDGMAVAPKGKIYISSTKSHKVIVMQ
jgi:DNA-binding beta-propeller fold protein YncE